MPGPTYRMGGSYISDKCWISGILYKELLQINYWNDKITLKWTKNLNRHFFRGYTDSW